MFKYRLLREEDGKYLIDKEFNSIEELYEWSQEIMDAWYRRGWV